LQLFAIVNVWHMQNALQTILRRLHCPCKICNWH